MSSDYDVVLLETVKTHRARLQAAFLFGELSERRATTDNMRRFLAGVILAAVACAACVGTSFVIDLLAQKAAADAEKTSMSAPLVPGSAL
ncbi:hypothetical protein [Cryobacterium sp.]|jgi:hypothetical protein|uniref:hypothetical protein n=1 Tax=Cryobacterium sp. TaxID=1926290 RepID=UPI0026045160|nr:hypothetical protein [Cryobacterium sp.]MCU1445009.1 putative rane protein [Cryobacterium sp.]